MDEGTKRKLRRVWYKRLILGVGFLTTLGFSVVQLQAIRSQMILDHQMLDLVMGLEESMSPQERMETLAKVDQMQKRLSQEKAQIEKTQLEPEQLTQLENLEQVLAQLNPHTNLQPTRMLNHSQVLARAKARWAQSQAREALWQRSQKQERLAQIQKQLQEQLQKQQELQQAQVQQVETQKLRQELLILGASAICLIISLLMLLKEQSPASSTFPGQFIFLLPEEYVAELDALRQRLVDKQKSTLLIQLVMLWCLLELFWAFYIQIKIENLWLPQKGGTKRIDE